MGGAARRHRSSPAMIEKARARGLYNALCVADIESAHGTYDLVIAADTLVYLGDLDAVMGAAASALKPGGFFLFTVEAKEGEGYERVLEATLAPLASLSARAGRDPRIHNRRPYGLRAAPGSGRPGRRFCGGAAAWIRLLSRQWGELP